MRGWSRGAAKSDSSSSMPSRGMKAWPAARKARHAVRARRRGWRLGLAGAGKTDSSIGGGGRRDVRYGSVPEVATRHAGVRAPRDVNMFKKVLTGRAERGYILF